MSTPATNNDAAMQAVYKKISEINEVEGFDPTPLAIDYTDLISSKTEKRLPVMAQMAWFRLKYPQGKLAVTVKPANNFFIAHARVYAHYNDPEGCFLAEASTTKKYDPAKSTVSPREWAQTAAIGIALRNAGFGLQFKAAGDSFDYDAVNENGDEPIIIPAIPEAGGEPLPAGTENTEEGAEYSEVDEDITPMTEPEDVEEIDPLQAAMRMPCPISRMRDKTLGDLITLDPKALAYIVKSTDYDPVVIEGARLICEHALQVVNTDA